MTTITLSDGTELKKGNFYWWSGYNEGYIINYTWKNTLCRITDIKNNTKIVIFDVFANKEYSWDIDSLNNRCTFKKFQRISDWLKKMLGRIE